jgi:hypothetical protein
MPDERDPNEKFDQWAIVEVMGHKKYAGRVTEQQIAGHGMVRVDVPEVKVGEKLQPEFTKLIGPASIYCITPVTEELARKAAARIAYESGDPIPVYIPQERQLPASVGASTDDFSIDADDDEDSDDGDRYGR